MGNSHIKANKSCISFLLGKIFKNKFLKLTTAIKEGNLTLVKSYFQSRINFNQYLNNGDMPIHIAAKYNHLEIARFIADNVHNLNINEENFVGDTPLMLAVMNGNILMVEYFIFKKFANVNIAENRGFTPFMAACANGNLSLVQLLVDQGADHKLKSRDGQTGLHRAAFYGNVDVVKYLIKDLKMSVMFPDKKGSLPLHFACMKLSFNCIRVLIKASNKPLHEMLHVQNKFEVKPLDIILKVLNRLREDSEVKEFTAEQIVTYLTDRHNPTSLREYTLSKST